MFNLTPVYRWYYNKLGAIDSPDFLRALREGQTLYKGIAGVNYSRMNLVRRHVTASHELIIPSWALNPKLYEEVSYNPQYAMAGVVNGIIAHSAALHRWLDDFAAPPANFYDEGITIKVANLVHDTWIASHNHRWMFFVKLYFDFLYSTPDTSDVVKFIASWRSEQCREIISQATPEIAEQLSRINYLSNKNTRLDVVQKIMDILKQDEQDNEQEQEDDQDNEQENEQEQDNEQDEQEEGDQESNGQEDSEQEGDDQEGVPGFSEGCKQDALLNQLPYEQKIDMLENFSAASEYRNLVQALTPQKNDLPIDLETRIIKTLETYEPVGHNGEFTQLGTLLDEKMSQRPKKVRPEIVGKKLQKRQLHRLATDGKVFGTSKVKRKVLPKQIFFLLDASSSIESSVGYEPILEAVSGALKGLKMGRNKCYTLAYTTDDKQLPVLTILGTPDTIQKVNAYPKIKHSFTPEPYMLNTMRKYIKANRLPKHEVFMFVLNDGKPCMISGSEEALVAMSKQQVRGLREDGVNVIALALTKGVIRSDSDIYGPEYTVDAQNLKQAILSILSELD